MAALEDETARAERGDAGQARRRRSAHCRANRWLPRRPPTRKPRRGRSSCRRNPARDGRGGLTIRRKAHRANRLPPRPAASCRTPDGATRSSPWRREWRCWGSCCTRCFRWGGRRIRPGWRGGDCQQGVRRRDRKRRSRSGRAECTADSLAGDYIFRVRVPQENGKVYRVFVDPSVYEKQREGEPFSFVEAEGIDVQRADSEPDSR